MLDKAVNFFLVHAAIVLPLVLILALAVSSTARAVVRMIARVAARLLLIGAVVALAYDGVRTASAGSGLVMTSLWEHWSRISPATLQAADTVVSKRLDPALWDKVLAPALHLPAWLIAGALALILGWLGRRRREVSVFVN
jgi:hypothetical protein